MSCCFNDHYHTLLLYLAKQIITESMPCSTTSEDITRSRSATITTTDALQLNFTLTSEDTRDVDNDRDDQRSRKIFKLYIPVGIVGGCVVSVLLLNIVMFTCISSRAKRVHAHANGREVRCYRNDSDELDSSCNFNNSSSIPMERNDLSYSFSSPHMEGEVITYYSSNIAYATATEKVQDDDMYTSCIVQSKEKENLASVNYSDGHGIKIHANIAYKPIFGESRTDSTNPIGHQNGAQDGTYYDKIITRENHCNESGCDERQSEDESTIEHVIELKPSSNRQSDGYETVDDKTGEFATEMEESEGYSYVLREGEGDSYEPNEDDTNEISMSNNIAYGQSFFSKV